MEHLNTEEIALNVRRKTRVQVVESETGTVMRELDASGRDPEKVADEAMRNLNPFHFFTRVVPMRSAESSRNLQV